MFLSDQDLLYALECCKPSELYDRDCFSCPLSGWDDCHSTLCDEASNFILECKAKSERFARGVDVVVDAVNNLHALY